MGQKYSFYVEADAIYRLNTCCLYIEVDIINRLDTSSQTTRQICPVFANGLGD